MDKKKTTRTEHMQHLETCCNCGKKLPVEVMRCSGQCVVGVFCKHCKTITIIQISG